MLRDRASPEEKTVDVGGSLMLKTTELFEVLLSSSMSIVLALIIGILFHVWSASYIEPFGIVYLFLSATIEEMTKVVGILSIRHEIRFKNLVVFGAWFGFVELVIKAIVYSSDLNHFENGFSKTAYTYTVLLSTMCMHILVAIVYINMTIPNKRLSRVLTVAVAITVHATLNIISLQLVGDKFPIDEFPRGHALLIIVYLATVYITHRKSLRVQSGR